MSIIRQTTSALAPARSFAANPLAPELLAKGIIVRSPNWLGDAVMTLPALKALRNLLPQQAPLTVIAPPQVTDLYRLYPGVDHIITIDRAHAKWSARSVARLQRLGSCVGVLFSNSLRDAWQMRWAGIKYLYGRSARCRGFLMKRTFKFPQWQPGMLNESHHTNEYLSIVQAMGAVRPEPLMPQLNSPLSMGQLSLKMQSFCQHPKLLLMAPGAAYGAAKRWASSNFNAVAAEYIRQGGIVAVLGSNSERRIGDEVISQLPLNRAFNLSGETTFSDLYNLIKSAQGCVANDSGIMHLAAALGLPGVAVFGPTDYRATGPVAENWLVVFDKEPCAPCFKRVCPSGSCNCMKKLQPQEVLQAMQQLHLL
ncbi:MAG: lipopolysaccharide heptosyltransferase II [Lentisphaerae bacterium]|nr:lipopolysaccharide heptosyltransferase II [Lentisphaerota bacterium]